MKQINVNKLNFKNIIAKHNASGLDILYANGLKKSHIFYCDCCTIEKGGYIVLDFGQEICGRAHLVFQFQSAPSKIRVRLGESVYEACAELGEKNAGNYHSLRDYTFDSVSWADISTSESGFRFVRIDVLTGEALKLSAVYAEEMLNGLEIKGSFACEDSQLQQIYMAAEKTLALCVRPDDIWDGVKRDRVMWIGDFYPELVGAAAIYGNIPQFEQTLASITDFKGKWVNQIPSYSGWWIICLHKYYQLFGEEEFVASMMPYVQEVVDAFSVIIKEKGEVSYQENKLEYYIENEFFIDWPTNLTADSETGWRYLIIIALKKAKELFEKFSYPCDTVESLLKKLLEYTYKPSAFKQVTALGVLADMIPKEEALALLKKDGTDGMTSFMGCIVIEALQKLGETDFIIQLIKTYFGAMVSLGATTFWEDFDMQWLKDDPMPLTAMPDESRKNIHADYGKFCYTGLRHSLCHGWSSGFVQTFYNYVLGVQTEDGYATIKIQPHLCGLQSVEGKIPTKYGIISIKHEMIDGKICTISNIPKQIKVIVS